MRGRTGLLAVGVGITTALLVGAIVTELASSAIEFSLFVGIPLGLLAGVLTGAGSLRILGTGDHRQVAMIGGVAAVGYTILGLAAVRYAVSAARDPLSVPVMLGIGLLVGVVVFGWLWAVDRRTTHPGA